MKKTVPILLLAALFAVAAWYSFVKKPDPVHELPPTLLPPVEVAEIDEPGSLIEESLNEVETAAAEVLPPIVDVTLTDSDVRQTFSDIIGSSATLEYLAKDQLISRFVATIDSLTSRQVPPLINPIKAVSGTLATESEGDRILMSTDNYTRYDGYISVLQDMDIDVLVDFYQSHYRWFQDAWEENGGEGSFNDRLLEVVEHLQQTPDVLEPVYLNKPEAVYLFEDPNLESMTAGQKILLRIGNANAAIVKQKLQQLHTRLTP